jgi:hypothetical protein
MRVLASALRTQQLQRYTTHRKSWSRSRRGQFRLPSSDFPAFFQGFWEKIKKIGG